MRILPGRARVLLAVAAASVGGAALLLSAGQSAPRQVAVVHEQLRVANGTAVGALQPGGVVTGSLLVTNPGERPRRLAAARFSPPTAGATGCRAPRVVLAPTFDAAQEVPAGGTAVVGWTAFMDGESEHACQGARLTSQVLLDGQPAGEVSLTAGTLARPPAPTGGLTTSSRAAVHWSPSTAAAPGWVLERAVAGTDDWQPACGSSPQRPVRALACTDTGLRRSTAYVYRLTLRTGHWHATSLPSRPVTTQARPSA